MADLKQSLLSFDVWVTDKSVIELMIRQSRHCHPTHKKSKERASSKQNCFG